MIWDDFCNIPLNATHYIFSFPLPTRLLCNSLSVTKKIKIPICTWWNALDCHMNAKCYRIKPRQHWGLDDRHLMMI